MPGGSLASFVLLPIGLGLFGFSEPCAIGATLLFIKTMEGAPAPTKVAQVIAFALSRAAFTGLLGAVAVVIGSLFLGLQKAIWLAAGLFYAGIGVLYLTGRIAPLMRSIGPRLAALSSPRGSIALGAALGLVRALRHASLGARSACLRSATPCALTPEQPLRLANQPGL